MGVTVLGVEKGSNSMCRRIVNNGLMVRQKVRIYRRCEGAKRDAKGI